MMKHKILIFLIALTVISCSKAEKTTYIGNIDNKVNGEIQISKNGNDIQGFFINLDKGFDIKLKGTIIGNKLAMQEYAKDNLISGFFEGEIIDGVEYKGNWLDKNKTVKKPFVFRLKSSILNSKKIEVKKSNASKPLELDQNKVKLGLEKRNIFLYKMLDEMTLSLSKLKNKLKEVENNDYYSKVKKEKKILKYNKEIEELNVVLSKTRNVIANTQVGKYYLFQKNPEGIVNHIFNCFRNKDFSKLEYILDPYGDYSDFVQVFALIDVVSSTVFFKDKMPDFEDVKFEIINTRIDNKIAYVLASVEKKHKNEEALFTLISRNGIWYLKDISN